MTYITNIKFTEFIFFIKGKRTKGIIKLYLRGRRQKENPSNTNVFKRVALGGTVVT